VDCDGIGLVDLAETVGFIELVRFFVNGTGVSTAVQVESGVMRESLQIHTDNELQAFRNRRAPLFKAPTKLQGYSYLSIYFQRHQFDRPLTG